MSLATAWLCHCWAAVSCTLPATSLTSCVVHDNAARISLKGYRYVQRNVLIITGVALQWYAHSMNQRWLNQNMESGVLMIVVSQYTTRTTPAGLYSEKWFLSLWYYSSSEHHFFLNQVTSKGDSTDEKDLIMSAWLATCHMPIVWMTWVRSRCRKHQHVVAPHWAFRVAKVTHSNYRLSVWRWVHRLWLSQKQKNKHF